MAAHGARRLLSMVENADSVVAIEYLSAAQGCDFHAPLTSSTVLERLRATLREIVPTLTDDRYFHADIDAALTLVRAGALIKTVTLAGVELPGV